jgi:hypothetical protein
MLDQMTTGGLEPSATPIAPDAVADLLLEIVRSGRTGENFGVRAGEPAALQERPPPHRRITG